LYVIIFAMKRKYLLIPILAGLCACSAETGLTSKDYILETDYKSDFKILQLTDIHLANKDNQTYQLKFLKSTIEKADPDFIVLTGDNFTFADRATAKRLFEFFESQKIRWTITFGNHDEQCYFSIDWMTSYLNNLSKKDGSYLLFVDHQGDKVNGNANFAINLMDGQTIKQQLIIIDSNRYYYGSYWGYDWIKEDQINWYSDLIDYTTAQNGGTVVPSLAFFHIPFPEYLDAWNAAQNGDPDATLLHGVAKEGVSAPEYNSGFWNKILEKGSTKVCSVGHDHLNDWTILYKGVYLSYGLTSTDRIYYDEELLGGKTITIHDDNTYEIELVFNKYGA